MTYALLAALVLTVGLFLHHIRETKRATDLQVSGLLNRIQAPELAVTQARIDENPAIDGPAYVEFDNDSDFWASKTPTRN